MLVTHFNTNTHTLSEVMEWAFDNLDKNIGYSLGFNNEGFLVVKGGGDTFIRDFAPTLQASYNPFPLSPQALPF